MLLDESMTLGHEALSNFTTQATSVLSVKIQDPYLFFYNYVCASVFLPRRAEEMSCVTLKCSGKASGLAFADS